MLSPNSLVLLGFSLFYWPLWPICQKQALFLLLFLKKGAIDDFAKPSASLQTLQTP